MSKVTEVVEQLVSPIVNDLELVLVDIEFVKEGSDWFLRVYIDTPKGISISINVLLSVKD